MKKMTISVYIIILIMSLILSYSCESTKGVTSDSLTATTEQTETGENTPVETIEGEELILNDKKVWISDIEQSKYSDTMKSGILAEAVTIEIGGNSIPLKKEEPVKFNTQYNYFIEGVLSEDITINTGKVTMTLKADTTISFMRAFSGEIYIYGGYLLADSELVIGIYRVDAAAQGNKYIRDILFGYKGDIIQVILKSDHTFIIKDERYTFSKGTRLSFINEKASGGVLKNNRKVKIGKYEVTALADTSIISSLNFTEDGNIFMVMLAEPSTIKVGAQRIPLQAKKFLTFHYNSDNPHFAYIGKDITLTVSGEKKALKAGAKVEFDRNGNIIKVQE
jgi:hypothetical protein